MITPIKKSLFIFSVVLLSLSVNAQTANAQNTSAKTDSPKTADGQTYQQLADKAVAYFEMDSLDASEKLFQQALRLEPSNPRNALLFSNIGMIQQKKRKYDQAIQYYTYALNIAPTAVPILLNRATVQMELGETNKAYVDYCQVLDVDKENKEAFLMRAYIYAMRRDYKAARADYTNLLRIDPANYPGRLGLATLCQKEGKYQEALQIINAMMAADEKDVTLYMMRSGIENDMGQTDAALLDLGEAIKLSPDLPDPYLLRAELYLEQNKKALAKHDLEKAVSLGIPQSEVRDLLRKCK